MEPIFQQAGLALLLGLLVGLQREHAASGIAGMRTFPLITLLGVVAAVLAQHFGGWIIAAGLLAIAALIAVHSPKVPRQPTNGGTTTEVTILLMYAVGALLVIGPTAVAVAIGGAAAVLLQFKPELHGFAKRLGDQDLRAIMQFVLITCIILPLLPQRTIVFWHDPRYAYLNVFNPFEIWLMVVLIVGMSLGGYILYKFLGQDAGTLLGGILGGAISSTATTVSYARMVRSDPAYAPSASIVIMIASAVSCLRVLAAVAVVSQGFLVTVAPPVLVVLVLTLAPAVLLWLRSRREPGRTPPQENPTELRPALVFGVMYAGVLFALAAAKAWLGDRGLYVVAGLSGLTEMDAITLSTARLSITDPAVAIDGWRMIILAVMANMFSKAMLAGILGGWCFGLRLVALFSLPMAGGALLLAWL
jgi:uncharacterized membrane protein (DUF4010 family)